MELAIDTSSDLSGLALAERGDILAEYTWHLGRNHTVELVAAVSRLLEGLRRDFAGLKLVAVARGPGSFNGLRAGLSAAKGFALALDVPLVGISTLEVEAFPFAFTGLPVCPLHDAGRGELAFALFQQVAGEWRRLEGDQLTSVEALCARTREKTVFCGEIPAAVVEKLGAELGPSAVVPPVEVRRRRAGYLAVLGWRRLESGVSDDVAGLQPIYLRRPHITYSASIVREGKETGGTWQE